LHREEEVLLEQKYLTVPTYTQLCPQAEYHSYPPGV
jgi:hypothetical protein